MKTIKAAGRSSAEAVSLTKAQAELGEDELEVLLDSPASAVDVRRFLESRNYGVILKDDDGMLIVAARKKSAVPPQPEPMEQAAAAPGEGRTFSVLITSLSLGRDEQGLGEALMKNFLAALPQAGAAAVALVNDGVKLALYDSSSCDHLKNLEKRGVPVLVCGMCVNHFQIADHIGAGTISNMPEMLETLSKADKIMTL